MGLNLVLLGVSWEPAHSFSFSAHHNPYGQKKFRLITWFAMEPRKNCAVEKLFTINVPHILEKIFFSLDYESFKRSTKVSKFWNDLLTSESFKMMGKSVFHEDIERELMDASIAGNTDVVREIFSTFMVDANKPCQYGARLHVVALASM